jgi:hypothetical protein
VLRHLRISGEAYNALIYNYGTLELRNVRIADAATVWGVINTEGEDVRLVHSVVSDNRPLSDGAETPAIDARSDHVTLVHSKVVRNVTHSAGVLGCQEHVDRQHTIIRNNTPQDCLPVDC